MPKFSRPVVLGVVLGLAVLTGAGGFAARQAASAAEPLEGNQTSAADVRILVRAAASCPSLTPARLAGQIMVASNFGSQPVEDMREGGRTGIAALTPEQWRKYEPWPGADPADREAGIMALAHAMCQTVGQVRAMKIDKDLWQIALAAHRTSMDAVIAAGDVPSEAKNYVETVDRYAAWYTLQPAFGGVAVTPPPAPTAVPVPAEYVAPIVAAGKSCKEVPATLIAAQIMATSGFDPDHLGPAGEQGIAQFLPRIWATTGKQVRTRTPWEPAVAIPALGKTMCKLVKQSGGQYAPALAAFTRGDADTATPLADVVTKAQTEYAKDTRLQPGGKAPASTAPKTASKSAKPAASSASAKPAKAPPTKKPSTVPTRTKRDQPLVKASDGDASGKTYGPYFIFNYATSQCADLPGQGPGTLDGRVFQYPCNTTGADNMEWSFVQRGTDADGYHYYLIKNTTDGLCFDLPGAGGVDSGTSLTETSCFEQDNQYYRLEPTVTKDGFQYYWVRNTTTGMCLDVPGAGNGGPDTQLSVVPCMSGDDHDWALVRKAEW